jgi:HD-GYP domain-containing protein (c-di-GMP phosphodiesterase class II)
MGIVQVEENLMLGGTYFNKGLVLAARDAWETAARFLTPDMPIQAAIRVHNALGSLHLQVNRVQEATEHFNQARSLCETYLTQNKSPIPDHPRALNNLVLSLLRSGDSDTGLPIILTAVELAEQLGSDPQLVASINITAGVCFMNNEDWAQAQVRMTHALEIHKRLGDQYSEVGCLINLGIIALEQNEHEQAKQALEAAQELLEEYYDASLSVYVRTELGRLYFHKGDVTAALHYSSSALRLLWDSMVFFDRAEVARLCRLFAHIFMLKGDRPAALSYLQRSTTYFAQRQMWREWSMATQELDKIIREKNVDKVRVVIEFQDQELLRYLTTLLGMMDTLESLYPESARHVGLVTQYALILGKACGLDNAQCSRLASAARLRDVGYTAEGEANGANSLHGGTHPVLGERILAMFNVPGEVLAAVRHHEERFDGSGYPDHLVGYDIPLEARILALAGDYVVHVDHELVNGPGYHRRAMAQLQKADHLYDPQLLFLLEQLHQRS